MCMLDNCHVLPGHFNRMERLLMLLVTLVLFFSPNNRCEKDFCRFQTTQYQPDNGQTRLECLEQKLALDATAVCFIPCSL